MEFVQPPAKVRHLWKSRLAKLTDEQRRALRVLASHPHGCPEDAMLEQGFTVVQLGQLGYDGLAKLRAAGRPGGFVVKITRGARLSGISNASTQFLPNLLGSRTSEVGTGTFNQFACSCRRHR
jgi:hypothetical protein